MPGLLLISIFLLVSVPAQAETHQHPVTACHEYLQQSPAGTDDVTIPFKNSLLWKAEKNDKTNYVLGTIHSQDYKVSSIPPPVRLALVKSKTLLMETIPSETANQVFFQNMYFADKQRLDQYLDPEILAELQRITVDYGVEKEKVVLLKPWAAFSLIGRPKPVRAATQEMNLLNVAQQTIPNIESLESMQEIIQSLESISMEDQITILQDTICNHANIIADAKTLVDLYVARDLAGIVTFNNQPHHDEAVFERFIQAILYDRNEKIMGRIEQAFAEGNTFVAIGASHLADEQGLLNKLQQLGYQLTPIY